MKKKKISKKLKNRLESIRKSIKDTNLSASIISEAIARSVKDKKLEWCDICKDYVKYGDFVDPMFHE